MGGLMRIAFQVFAFIMVVTCWKQLLHVCIYLVQMVAGLFMQLLDGVEEWIERIAYGRKD